MKIHFKNYQQSDRLLNLNEVQIMGILNVTPDSFSDSGRFLTVDNALYQTEKMLADGATIIDIGGESTRPQAIPVSSEEELARVIPVIEAIRKRFDCLISIDTTKPSVMHAAAVAGADIINDIQALQTENALSTVAQLQLPVCIMHMQGSPQTMQLSPCYENVVEEVATFLNQRILACLNAGIAKNHIILDVGFGFGKTVEHNYQLLKHLSTFTSAGYPLLVGLSRKSMIGHILNQPVDQRVIGSVVAALFAVQNGASILRVHDVKETVEALKIWQAIQQVA